MRGEALHDLHIIARNRKFMGHLLLRNKKQNRALFPWGACVIHANFKSWLVLIGKFSRYGYVHFSLIFLEGREKTEYVGFFEQNLNGIIRPWSVALL